MHECVILDDNVNKLKRNQQKCNLITGKTSHTVDILYICHIIYVK